MHGVSRIYRLCSGRHSGTGGTDGRCVGRSTTEPQSCNQFHSRVLNMDENMQLWEGQDHSAVMVFNGGMHVIGGWNASSHVGLVERIHDEVGASITGSWIAIVYTSCFRPLLYILIYRDPVNPITSFS